MSVIKAENVNYSNPQQRFITIQIPILDTGHTPEQKRRKMLEEIDELLSEFSTGQVDKSYALAEVFDVLQVMAGYLIDESKEFLAPKQAYEFATTLMRNANEQHIEKMRNYAAERRWKLVSGCKTESSSSAEERRV